MKPKSNQGVIRTIFKLYKKKSCIYLGSMLTSQVLVSVCYNLVLAFIMQEVCDAIVSHDINLIKNAVIIAGVSFLVAFTLKPLAEKVYKGATRDLMKEIRVKTFDQIEKMKVSAFEAHSIGDLISTLSTDMESVQNIFIAAMPQLGFAIIHGSLAILFMLCINWKLAFVGVAIGLSGIAVNYFITKPMKKCAMSYQNTCGEMTQQVLDIEDGFMDIKISQSEKHFLDKFNICNGKLKKYYHDREKYGVLLETANTLFGTFNSIGLMAIGLYMSLKGEVSIGKVMAIIHLQGNASFLYQNLSTFIEAMQKTIPSLKRIEDIWQIETDEEKIKDKGEENRKGEAIELERVTFSYHDNDQVLKGIDLVIPDGSAIGIVGESGGGKSTLIKLLLGFYQPTDGLINLKGKKVSYLSQDYYLFNMTIEENIRLGKLDATKEEVVAASKLAHAHDFISKLEKGYDTLISEQAGEFSGGQRQRIALARAFLSPAEILIMDEATSALDEETERYINESIQALRGKKTIIMIAHRPAILKSMDVVYTLKEGRLGEMESTYQLA